MPKTEDFQQDNEKLNPDEGGPFRLGKYLNRNKRQVTPDASLLKIVNAEESQSFWAHWKRWFLRNHGPVGLLIIFILGSSYLIPERYAPQFTDLVFGVVLLALVGAASLAYEYEKRQDKSHNVFVDKIKIKLKETIVGREKGKNGTETKVIVPEITEREIHLAKDYMFEGKPGDPYRIEKYNCQIVGTFGKILDVTEVDDSGRILIGDGGDGDMPSGLIVKIAYPSRTELSDEVKKADKLRKEGAIGEAQFLKFKGLVDAYNTMRDGLIGYAQKEGVSMISMDSLTKKQKSFFVALDKHSTDYWTGNNRNDPMSMAEWKALDPSIALPKILKLQTDYNDIKNEKIDLLLNRESDKMEAELGATVNLMEMTGMSEEAIKQFLLEQRKGLVSVSSRSEEEMGREVHGGRED